MNRILLTLATLLYIPSLIATSPRYSLSELYQLWQADPEQFSLIKDNLIEHEDYYLRLIDQQIQKRIGEGQKVGIKPMVFKIAKGMAFLSGGILGVIGSRLVYQHNKTSSLVSWGCHSATFLSLWLIIYSIGQCYNGIRYTSRMQEKYARDKDVQRHIRKVLGYLNTGFLFNQQA